MLNDLGYSNTLPGLLFICGSFHYLQMLSKNTEEKCVLLGAHSLKAEVRRNALFLLMQFYRELGKKRSLVCMLLRSRLWLIIQRLPTLNEFKFILLSFRILRSFFLLPESLPFVVSLTFCLSQSYYIWTIITTVDFSPRQFCCIWSLIKKSICSVRTLTIAA